MPEDDPEKPMTVFEDVQCRDCGNYQYAPNAEDSCPSCGATYDWEWNVATGRVKQETADKRAP